MKMSLLAHNYWPWRLVFEKERLGYLIRLMRRYSCELAYLSIGINGLQAEIEFPSDWHQEKCGWIRLGLGLGLIAFSFPWSKAVPDEGQCSGPTYGFQFYQDLLWLNYGKSTGRPRKSKTITINMPWHWRHQWHREYPGTLQVHPYRYLLNNGTAQERTASIQVEERLWTRYWIPWRKLSRYIDVKFSDEVGERTGSWKGGTLGCWYELNPAETPLECLRRMERERSF